MSGDAAVMFLVALGHPDLAALGLKR